MKIRALSLSLLFAFGCLSSSAGAVPNAKTIQPAPSKVAKPISVPPKDAPTKTAASETKAGVSIKDLATLVEAKMTIEKLAEKLPFDEPLAEYLWSSVVSLDKTIYEPTSIRLTKGLNKYAECLRVLRLDKGEFYGMRAGTLERLESDLTVEPIDTYMVSYDLNELAHSYLKEEDFPSADHVMAHAIEYDRRDATNGDACLCRDLLMAAMIKRMKYDHEGALKCLDESIKLHEKLYGVHPQNKDLFAAASKHKDEKPLRLDMAVAEFEELAASDANLLEPLDARAGLTQFQLADTYFCLREEDLARSIWKRADIIESNALYKRIRGETRFDRGELGELADLYASSQNFELAEKIMQQSIRSARPGDAQGDAAARARLGRYYLKTKKYKEAQNEFVAVLKRYSEGQVKQYSASVWSDLAEAYEKDNNSDLATKTFEDGLKFLKEKSKYTVSTLMNSYAAYSRSHGKFEKAQNLRERAQQSLLDDLKSTGENSEDN